MRLVWLFRDWQRNALLEKLWKISLKQKKRIPINHIYKIPYVGASERKVELLSLVSYTLGRQKQCLFTTEKGWELPRLAETVVLYRERKTRAKGA